MNGMFSPLEITPEQFTNFLATDTPRWGKLIRDIGVKVD